MVENARDGEKRDEWAFGADGANQPDDGSAIESPLSTTQKVLLALCYWPTIVALVCLGLVVVDLVISSTWVVLALGAAALTLVWRLGRVGWRVLQAGRFRAGVVVGALGWFYGPLYGIAAIVLLSTGAHCSDIDLERALQLDSEALQDAPSGTRSWGNAFVSTSVGDGFANCVDILYEREGTNGAINAAIFAMLRPDSRPSSRSLSSAQVLVYDVVVDVCLAHASDPKDDLGSYFGAALRNRKTKIWKETQPFDVCSIEIEGPSYDPNVGLMIDLRRAMCALPKQENDIITLRAQGFTYSEISKKLSISESQVGNKVSAALNSLAQSLGHDRRKSQKKRSY